MLSPLLLRIHLVVAIVHEFNGDTATAWAYLNHLFWVSLELSCATYLSAVPFVVLLELTNVCFSYFRVHSFNGLFQVINLVLDIRVQLGRILSLVLNRIRLNGYEVVIKFPEARDVVET